MLKKLLPAAITLSACLAAFADELALNPNHPQTYTVQTGDTLWDLAGKFLQEPWHWKELWQANPQVQDPHWIYPGDVLRLTYRDGRPILTKIGGRNVKLSPQIRGTAHEDALRPIPIDAIQQFLSEPRVVGATTLLEAPYVVASEDQHLVNGSGNRVYVKNLPHDQGNRFSIFRGGKVYRDPDDGDRVIGYEAMHVGEAVIERFGDPSSARIVSSMREVLNGDRLLPYDEQVISQFIPRPPEKEVSGRIVSVVDGVSQIGQFQVVVLSLGRKSGIEPGHVLAVWQAGKTINDYVTNTPVSDVALPAAGRGTGKKNDGNWIKSAFNAVTTDTRDVNRTIKEKYGSQINAKYKPVELPDERAGHVVVFRSFDEVSYALVMETLRPMHAQDRVRNP